MKPSKRLSLPGPREKRVIASLSPQRNAFLLLIILLAGLTLRLSYLFEFRQTPFFNAQILIGLDQHTWDDMGAKIVRSPWLADGKPFYQAPGYAYFLAVVYTLFGIHNYLAAGILQILLDLVNLYLLFLLGCRLWNRRVGLLAAFFYAFYRPFIYYSATLLSDSFILFTNILALFLTYWTIEEPEMKHRWFLAGLGFGLATIAKPTILLFLFFAFLAFFFLIFFQKRTGKFVLRLSSRIMISGISLFLCGFFMLVLPVAIRNSLLAKKFVTVATYGTINWQIGNSADSIGLFCYPKGPLLSPKTKAFWKLWGRKTIFFFSSYEWPQNLNIYLLAHITRTLRLPLFTFGFFAPLGLAGLLFFQEAKRPLSFVQAYTLANILSVIVFFVTSRYRLPATAGFILLGAGYLDFLFGVFRKRRKDLCSKEVLFLHRKNLIKMAASLLLIFIVSFTWVSAWSGDRIGEVFVKTYAIFTEKDVAYDLAGGNLSLAEKKRERFQNFLRDYLSGKIK